MVWGEDPFVVARLPGGVLVWHPRGVQHHGLPGRARCVDHRGKLKPSAAMTAGMGVGWLVGGWWLVVVGFR